MKALCMITVKPGMVDNVVQILRKKRKISKDIMIVTGRADISVILDSSMDEFKITDMSALPVTIMISFEIFLFFLKI